MHAESSSTPVKHVVCRLQLLSCDRVWAQEMYERPRQAANTRMASALDGLKRIYEPQQGLLAAARGLGLDVLNASPGGKARIMQYAMGG